MNHKAFWLWIAWPPLFEAPTSHTAARGDLILVRYSSCSGDHLDLCLRCAMVGVVKNQARQQMGEG